MRKVIRNFAVLCLAMSGAGAVPLAAARAQADVAKEITRLEDSWAVAQVKHDGVALAAMISDDCTMGEWDGKLMNKAEAIADIKDPKKQYVSVVNSENKVTVKGGTALVTGIWTETLKGAKGNEVKRYRYTDTWMKQPDGKWLYVGGQSALLANK